MSRLFIRAENENGKTVISDCEFTSPIKIAKPFYRENFTEIIMMTASAGMLDGDIYDIEIKVCSGAKLKFTGQSFTKIFKSGEKGGVFQKVKIHVENGGTLFYLPKPIIPFAESCFENRAEIFLENSSHFVMGDIISCGRKAMNEEFLFNEYRSRTAVHIDGKLDFLDNIRLAPKEFSPTGIGFFEGYSHIGTYYFYGVDVPGLSDITGAEFAATKTYRGNCIRIAADSAEKIFSSEAAIRFR